MGQLYDRRIEFSVAAPVPDFGQTGRLVLTMTDMRMQFKVTKTLGKEPNKCEVTVTNLSRDSRALIQSRGGKFILKAGYVTTGTQQLFTGDIRTCSHVRNGADWESKIDSGDGERAYRWSRVNKSFKAGTSQADVIKAIIASMKLGAGNSSATADQLSAQFVHGYSAHGHAAIELDRILRSSGYSWSIQDGAVQLLKNDSNLPGTAVLLGPDSGLIGSPEFGAADKNKGPVVSFKSLLQPQIRCGGQVKLQSERYKGFVRVTQVEHTGDTAGGDWYTSCQAEPI